MNVPELLASIILTIVGAATTWLLAAGALWLQKHVSSDKLALGMTIAQVAVQATEQIAAKTGWDGDTKFKVAQERLLALAKNTGINLTPEQVSSLIEHAVHQLKESQELLRAAADPLP
jgi:hypothetical protein